MDKRGIFFIAAFALIATSCGKPRPGTLAPIVYDKVYSVKSVNAFRWYDGELYATPDHFVRRIVDEKAQDLTLTVGLDLECYRRGFDLVAKGFETATGLRVRKQGSLGCEAIDVPEDQVITWRETYADIVDFRLTPEQLAAHGGRWEGEGDGYTFVSEVDADGAFRAEFRDAGGALTQTEFGHAMIVGDRQHIVIESYATGEGGEVTPYILKPYNIYQITELPNGEFKVWDTVSRRSQIMRRARTER